MLILTRKLGESITVGDHIRITFLDVKGRHIRVGIEAPKDVMVHREEVYRLVREQNRRAAAADMSLTDLWGRLQGRSTS